MTNISDITKQIKIRVTAKLEEEQAELYGANFIHSYRIEIENLSLQAVQLMRRHWIINDALAGKRVVEGEGVIGEQPVIEPGKTYAYTSWCPLISEIGTMTGYYTFKSLDTDEYFEVDIPPFQLSPAYSLN